jgi:hypothetical protein
MMRYDIFEELEGRLAGGQKIVTDIRETLLLEVHRAIETAAREAVSKLGRPRPAPTVSDPESALERSVHALRSSLLVYPPMNATGPQLTPAETEAISAMTLSSEARSALEKLCADAAAAAFFRFFCVLDGVSDPEVQRVQPWHGAVFADSAGEGDRAMLHDQFFDSYFRYREAMDRPAAV